MPSGRRHYRITQADALGAHERALRSGGLPGVKNIDDLLSSIGRPYHGYHRSIQKKAAALFEAVATGHGFNDANKRTAVILTDLLLVGSGYVLEALNNEDLNKAIEEFAVAVVKHEYDFDGIVAWFKVRIRKIAG